MANKLIFYINDKFVSEDKALISVLDLGYVRGYGVFDFLRTYQGKPFKLDEHLKRLENSASLICLKLPKPLREIKNLVLETLKRNAFPEANIKIIVSGGKSGDGITPEEKPTLAILVFPPTVYPKSFYTNGIKVITVPLTRSFPESKTLNYIPGIMALSQAHKQKAAEAIYSQKSSAYRNEKDEVFEGTTTNFFVFKKSVLITPKDGILSGITREVVLELAKKEFGIELRPIKYQELKTIDEAFITASNKEIMPVVKIDDIIVGNGKVGSNTKKLMELFRKYTLL